MRRGTEAFEHASRVVGRWNESLRIAGALRQQSSRNPLKRWRARRYLKNIPVERINDVPSGPHLHFEQRKDR